MAETLYATFDDASLAEKAVGALLDHGVRHEDISVVSQRPANRDDTPAEHEGRHNDHAEKAGKSGLSTTTAGDAESGAAKGAGIGLGLGVAAAAASLFIPGIGLVIGGGALATAVAAAAGTTAAGAVAGGVTGYLKDQGVPDEAATDYERAYKNGSAILTVHMGSGKVSKAEIQGILSKYQARTMNDYAGSVR